MIRKRISIFILLNVSLFISLVFFSTYSLAEISNDGVLDQIIQSYADVASSWQAGITQKASWLFWMLASISMVWTFGFMAVRGADIGEFFAELIRFVTFTGFFWWLLINAPEYATAIIDSLKMIGADATGLSDSLTPSSIIDIGFDLFYQSISNSAFWNPYDSLIAFFMGMMVLITLTLVASHIVVLLVSGWFLAYGGIFCLGFGGSRWTSGMAIQYYKTVLSVAVSLFVMILIVGIGKTFLLDYKNQMSANFNFKEMAVMVVICITLLGLVNKIPRIIVSTITEMGFGSTGGLVAIGLQNATNVQTVFSGDVASFGATYENTSLESAAQQGQKITGYSASGSPFVIDKSSSLKSGSGTSQNTNSLASAMGDNV